MGQSKQEYYRINLKLPLECKEYLQEMTWRTRSKSITAYLTALIEKDMEHNSDLRDNVANKLRTIARDLSITGVPDMLTATLSLCDAFDCDYINRDKEGE